MALVDRQWLPQGGNKFSIPLLDNMEWGSEKFFKYPGNTAKIRPESDFITNSKGAAEDLIVICNEYGLKYQERKEKGYHIVSIIAKKEEISAIKENEIDRKKFKIINYTLP